MWLDSELLSNIQVNGFDCISVYPTQVTAVANGEAAAVTHTGNGAQDLKSCDGKHHLVVQGFQLVYEKILTTRCV